MKKEAANIFGYYDHPDQTEPAYDPGMQVPCPICFNPVENPDTSESIVTVSIMATDSDRAYFYRMHKRCFGSASDEEIQRVEDSLVSTKNVSH